MSDSNWSIHAGWITVVIVLNAILGLIMFEWAWKDTYRYRNPIKELDDKFPAYRRTDAAKWKKCHFYIGAMTILVPRMLSIVFNMVGLTLAAKTFMCCNRQ